MIEAFEAVLDISGSDRAHILGYLRVGRVGAERPLLLITGTGANLDMWAPFARLVGVVN